MPATVFYNDMNESVCYNFCYLVAWSTGNQVTVLMLVALNTRQFLLQLIT